MHVFLWFQGHAAPILYAAWAEAGLFPESELLQLRKLNHDLEGHPTPVSATALKALPLFNSIITSLTYFQDTLVVASKRNDKEQVDPVG